MGYAHASLERVEFAVKQAISASRAGRPDKDFKSLPPAERYPLSPAPGTTRSHHSTSQPSRNWRLTSPKHRVFDKRIDIVNSGASVRTVSDAIANTFGVSGNGQWNAGGA